MLDQVLAHYGLDTDRDWGEHPVTAICHDDKHKSASINWDKGVYNCHTCNWGGDAITIIMHMEGLTYRDAVRFAEETFGGSGRTVRPSQERDGYLIPGSKRDTSKRRRYVPSWKRG